MARSGSGGRPHEPSSRRRTRSGLRRWAIAALASAEVAVGSWIVAPPAGGAALSLAPLQGSRVATRDAAPAREIRSIYTSEFGIPRPEGLAYVPATGVLLVAAGERLLELTPTEKVVGSLHVPGLAEPTALAFDPASQRLIAVRSGELLRAPISDPSKVRRSNVDHLGLQDLRGATFDPSGAWSLLDAGTRAVVRVEPAAELSASPSTTVHLRGAAPGRLRGLAYNPADGLLYVANVGRQLLYGVDRTGEVRATYDLEGVDIGKLSAMVFAPSADPTDDPGTMHLYVADAGDRSTLGRVVEVTLAPAVTVAAPIDTATLVQTIDASKFNPPSPDPAGVTYRPSADRLLIADSEVDETTGAGYHGVNLWEMTRTGTVTDTGTTVPFTNEPTGLGFDPGTDTLFVSTDVGNRIWVDRPGPDGRFGTSDDVLTSINTKAYGLTDTEDPEFDPSTGHLFFVDGVSVEVYELDPVNGVFGDGDDAMTHFDVGQYGATDAEGLGSDPARNTLLVGDRSSKKIYEVTKDGALVRIIDASGIPGMKRLSGLAMAPASDDPSAMNYWIVDRAVDNGSNPNENDGKIFEISVPASGNAPPAVDAGPDQTTTLPDPATLQGSVVDDGLPDPPGTTTSGWSKVSGPGTVTFADPATTTATATFSTDGTYVLRLTADDSQAQSSDEMTVTVLPEGTATTTIPAEADAFVLSSNPEANRGGSTSLRILNNIKISYVRFNVPALPTSAEVSAATLRMYATTGSKCSLGVEVLRAANDTWGETTITWSNQPGPTGAVIASASWTAKGYRDFNVTSAVTGAGPVSFVIRHAAGCNVTSGASLNSREATTNQPQLVVEKRVLAG